MNDRLIQLIALIVVAGGLLGGVMLTPTINDQRRDRQLTYDIEVGDATNPEYAFLASLGSLRGLAVHALWYRAEQLKQQGKFYEANNLAEMITKLQPRFPQVWLFQGWNMAYNISVKTNTPEERWDWVNKGMNLLRNPGIRNNPSSPTLYKELSWIFSHKMGGQTDDMNNYYKREFCEEWQIVLGEPPMVPQLRKPYRGMTREQVLSKIGQDAFDRNEHVEYVARSTALMAELVTFGDRYVREPDAGDGVYGTRYYYPTLNPDSRKRFLEDYPEQARLVEALEAATGPDGENAGLGMNTPTLLAYGKIFMYEGAGYNLNDPRIGNIEVLGDTGIALLETLKQLPPEVREIDPKPLILLLRAQALVTEYNMDPRFMLRCMEQYGELDWRHVHTHAAYWSSLGTFTFAANAKDKDLTRIDLINTDRATIHAVQGLVHGGKIYFRPRVEPLARETNGMLGTGIYDQQPDPALIPAYGVALGFTRERIESGKFGDLSTDTYDQGWENFLQVALVYYYFGGDMDQAQETWAQLKEQFGNSDRSAIARDGEYRLPLDQFVIVRLEDDLGYQDEYLVRSLIRWALQRGIASRDLGLTNRLLVAAKGKYDQIVEERADAGRHTGLAQEDVQGRRALNPWPVIIEAEFSMFLTNPGYPLLDRSTIWTIASQALSTMSQDAPMHFLMYYAMRPTIEAQIAAQQLGVTDKDAQGRDVRRLARYEEVFEKPTGFDQWLQREMQRQNQGQPGGPPPTIRRQ